jgi:Outer membrane protein beta-barrel domain
MMRFAVLSLVVLLCVGAPALMAQSDHFEVGAFADFFNLSRTSPHINYAGLGARVGFNVHPNVQIEAEMSYDFERNFTSVFSDGIDTQFVRSHTRPITGLFGPKFQTSSGPFRAFATFKAGFINFSTSNENVPDGFVGGLGGVTSGDTRAAIYPGVGVEGFWGPFGLRLDGGDEIYFDGGARNNLKVTFGPVLRF